MEDVQDGKKVSIQDGVMEDPEFEKQFELGQKSYVSLQYIIQEIPHPQITTKAEATTDSEDLTLTITTIAGTSVA